jgi:6-pyruvoyltetrahydropterin/6-carboxytetrahydropterin synthase
MYKIKVVNSFSSAHFLRGYKGKCENLHGHNWKVEAAVCSKKLDKLGMVMDFSELKKELKVILEELDHKLLNDLKYFKKINPSSENICRYIYDCLRNPIEKKGLKLLEVVVWETETSRASYSL